MGEACLAVFAITNYFISSSVCSNYNLPDFWLCLTVFDTLMLVFTGTLDE